MSDVPGVPAGQPLDYSPVSRKIYTAPWWQIHAWAIGGIASYFMYEQFYLINNIHTTTFKVNPGIVFLIMSLPRVFDGLIDPLIGHWSDNMRSRWGRRRPFLLASAIMGAILASSMFWMSPEWPQWLKGLILGFSAITLFTACGTYDMAHTALGYELSDEYADRSRIQAIKGVYWSVVGIVGGYLITMAGNLHNIGDFLFGAPPHNWLSAWATWRPQLLDNSVKSGGNEVIGFRVLSAIVSLMILVSVLFPLFWSKERFLKINERKHVNIWKALGATFRCRPFLIILIINFTKGAGTLPRNLFFYIGTYYVCSGDKEHYSKIMAGDFAVWGLLIAIGVWLLTKPITKLIGKRTAFIASAGVGLVQALGTPLVAIPGHIEYWFWFNLFFLPIGMVLNASAAGIMPDVCDIDELEYGERREGLFTSVQSFVNKMEISVMTLLTGVFLIWTGFKADYGNIQPPDVLARMRWMAFTPLIFIALVSFVVSCFMPITKKMMDGVRAELDARHAAEGVPGVPPQGAEETASE